MPMTDTDRLATPADLADVLRRLTSILRGVEALPGPAQQRFWEDLRVPADDLRVDADVSLRTVTMLYNILATMCGPRLNELLTGDAKEYYERMLAEMQTMQRHPWEAFLDQKFEETKGAGLAASVTLAIVGKIGRGTVKRADADGKLLVLTDTGRDRYFASKDILVLEFEKTPA